MRQPVEDRDTAAVRHAALELEAARRRVDRDRQRVLDDTRAALVADSLPVLDNLDRSIMASAADTQDPALLEGIRLVRGQFEDALAKQGLERVESVGHVFDPAQHDAIAVVPVTDPELDGKVIDEWAAGFRLGDRMLRPAKVRVGRLERD